MLSLEAPCMANSYHDTHIHLVLESYQKLLKKQFLDLTADLINAKKIYEADFALLTHDMDIDPKFNYANRKALQIFEYTWQELIGKPSRFSVETIEQQQRDRLLAEVSANGYIENYTGIRIGQTGKRFLIKNAVVWNVFDNAGRRYGQAAYFNEWNFI